MPRDDYMVPTLTDPGPQLAPRPDSLDAVTKERDDLRKELEVEQEQNRLTHQRLDDALADVARLTELLNTPELKDFAKAVPLEAAHQRIRWGSDHDAGKTPADWFWLIGYLAGKALHCHIEGKTEKALHHTITAAAALANWHSAILGKIDMRPGIVPPKEEAGDG